MSTKDDGLYRGDRPASGDPDRPTDPGLTPPRFTKAQDHGQPYPQGQGLAQGAQGYGPTYGQGYGHPAPGYGSPPGYPPAGYPAGGYQRPTNTMAILALVMAFVFAPAGLVLGVLARKQIRQTGEEGDGLALAGIIVGGVATALFVLAFVFFLVVVVSFGPADF